MGLLKKTTLVLVMVCTLSACALIKTHPNKPTPASQVRSAAVSPADQMLVQDADASRVDELDEAIPKQALNAALLSDILTSNLASYNGDWFTAYQYAFQAAQGSKDQRLAQFSTLLAFNLADYKKVFTASNYWLELEPENEQAKYSLLLSQVSVGEFDEAYAGLSRLLRTNQEEGIRQVAGLLIKQNNGKAAISLMQQFVADHAEVVQVLISAAYVAQFFDDHEQAGAWVNDALTKEPNNEIAAQIYLGYLQQQGKADQRRQFLERFVADNPKAVTIQLGYASELSKNKRYEAAYQVVKQVLNIEPDNLNALLFAANLSEYNAQLSAAKTHYADILNIAPDNDNARFSLARIALTEEKYTQAEKLYLQIKDPQYMFEAQLRLANIYYQTRGIDAAMRQLDRIELNTNSDYVEHVMTRHQLLYQAQRYQEALGYINEAILFLPEYLDFLYARALVAAEIGDVSIAEKDLRAILLEHPEHANALNALGYTLADQTNRFDEAKQLIVKALSLRPNDAHILDSMGWVLYRLKDFSQAIEYLQKAYSASQEAEIAAHLGEVLWEAGQRQSALEVWTKAADGEAENRVLNAVMRKYDALK